MPPIRILTQFFTLVANVLLDGDVHLGGLAKEEQQEEKDRVLSFHLEIFASTTS